MVLLFDSEVTKEAYVNILNRTGAREVLARVDSLYGIVFSLQCIYNR
jgi:hypothetical protein